MRITHTKGIWWVGCTLAILIVFLLSACKKADLRINEELRQREDLIIREYLANNNIEAQRLPSGLYYTILRQGVGPLAQVGDTVNVDYEGRLLYGKVFDSSYNTGQPLGFRIGRNQVVAGFDEGARRVGTNGKVRVFMPSYLGYGSAGNTDRLTNEVIIPPNAILVFDIEMRFISRL